MREVSCRGRQRRPADGRQRAARRSISPPPNGSASRSDVEIVATLRDGRGAMPPFKDVISAQQIATLAVRANAPASVISSSPSSIPRHHAEKDRHRARADRSRGRHRRAVVSAGAYPKMRPAPQMTAPNSPDAIERGRYLAEAMTGCPACHSPIDESRPGDFSQPGSARAACFLPIRDSRARQWRRTSRIQTGIGRWTDGEVARAIPRRCQPRRPSALSADELSQLPHPVRR